jgi:hypothetical protein
LQAIKDWTKEHVLPGSTVFPDGLGCLRGATEASCKHVAEIAGGRKPKDLTNFQSLKTIAESSKTK